MSDPRDPFKEARGKCPIHSTEFNGEQIPFVLGLKDLRKTVKDWQSFSSDHPFKVVPHTEEKMRSMRQIPIEKWIRPTIPIIEPWWSHFLSVRITRNILLIWRV